MTCILPFRSWLAPTSRSDGILYSFFGGSWGGRLALMAWLATASLDQKPEEFRVLIVVARDPVSTDFQRSSSSLQHVHTRSPVADNTAYFLDSIM